MLAGWLEESDENRAYFRECLSPDGSSRVGKAEREWARFAARNKILFAVPRSPDGAGVGSCAMWRRPPWLAGVCAVWFWQRTPMSRPKPGPGRRSAPHSLGIPHGVRREAHIVLPDGSKVCMNSEATLTVDPDSGRRREIEFDGEAFFTISPDKNCPFIIHSANNNYTGAGNVVQPAILRPGEFRRGDAPYGCLQAQARKRHHPRPLDTAIVFWIAASACRSSSRCSSKKSHA